MQAAKLFAQSISTADSFAERLGMASINAGQHQVTQTMMTGSGQQTAPPGAPLHPRPQLKPAPVGVRLTPWTGCCTSKISLNANSCPKTLTLEILSPLAGDQILAWSVVDG